MGNLAAISNIGANTTQKVSLKTTSANSTQQIFGEATGKPIKAFDPIAEQKVYKTKEFKDEVTNKPQPSNIKPTDDCQTVKNKQMEYIFGSFTHLYSTNPIKQDKDGLNPFAA